MRNYPSIQVPLDLISDSLSLYHDIAQTPRHGRFLRGVAHPGRGRPNGRSARDVPGGPKLGRSGPLAGAPDTSRAAAVPPRRCRSITLPTGGSATGRKTTPCLTSVRCRLADSETKRRAGADGSKDDLSRGRGWQTSRRANRRAARIASARRMDRRMAHGDEHAGGSGKAMKENLR